MPAHSDLAIQMLNEAASFFRRLGEQNEAIRTQITQNAKVFEQVAALLEKNPAGRVGEKTYIQMAVKLLEDAAGFFRRLGDQNELIREQMEQNAIVYEQMGALLEKDPEGNLG
ncbi:MAG: hypothetical protein ACT4OY_04805 [Alphaproteobacteria bacterium]